MLYLRSKGKCKHLDLVIKIYVIFKCDCIFPTVGSFFLLYIQGILHKNDFYRADLEMALIPPANYRLKANFSDEPTFPSNLTRGCIENAG